MNPSEASLARCERRRETLAMDGIEWCVFVSETDDDVDWSCGWLKLHVLAHVSVCIYLIHQKWKRENCCTVWWVDLHLDAINLSHWPGNNNFRSFSARYCSADNKEQVWIFPEQLSAQLRRTREDLWDQVSAFSRTHKHIIIVHAALRSLALSNHHARGSTNCYDIVKVPIESHPLRIFLKSAINSSTWAKEFCCFNCVHLRTEKRL